jgi:hypothetical protein
MALINNSQRNTFKTKPSSGASIADYFNVKTIRSTKVGYCLSYQVFSHQHLSIFLMRWMFIEVSGPSAYNSIKPRHEICYSTIDEPKWHILNIKQPLIYIPSHVLNIIPFAFSSRFKLSLPNSCNFTFHVSKESIYCILIRQEVEVWDSIPR